MGVSEKIRNINLKTIRGQMVKIKLMTKMIPKSKNNQLRKPS